MDETKKASTSKKREEGQDCSMHTAGITINSSGNNNRWTIIINNKVVINTQNASLYPITQRLEMALDYRGSKKSSS